MDIDVFARHIGELINKLVEQKLKQRDEQQLGKLEWGKTCEEKLNWQDAKDWCEKQGKGWRLPTILELWQAKIDGIDGFEAGFYWSSTEYSATSAWTYYWPGAYPSTYNKDLDYYVRCVKGGKNLI